MLSRAYRASFSASSARGVRLSARAFARDNDGLFCCFAMSLILFQICRVCSENTNERPCDQDRVSSWNKRSSALPMLLRDFHWTTGEVIQLRYPMSSAAWLMPWLMRIRSLASFVAMRSVSLATRLSLPSDCSRVASYVACPSSMSKTAVMCAWSASLLMNSIPSLPSGSPSIRVLRICKAVMTVVLPEPFCPYRPVTLAPLSKSLNVMDPFRVFFAFSNARRRSRII